MTDAAPLLEIRHVTQEYGGRKRPFVAIEDVSLALREGELLSLLGPSGCGKSTLLRIATGLQAATRGKVCYHGQPSSGVNPKAAIVFQTFALFPWLTVQQNVEVALKAQGIGATERTARALKVLDRVGLDGFESAYPRELSGGMRQKAGFARAMAVEPELLCLDEPFSALDVLSGEVLRNELLELWTSGTMTTRAILMVTHNIEEAVLMCDRILVFSSNPGRIVAEIAVDLPRPRDRQDPAFRALVDSIYARMTGSAETGRTGQSDGAVHGTGTAMMLSRVSTNTLAGLMETIAGPPFGGKADLPLLGERTHLEAHDLIKAVETLQLLHFAEVAEGDVTLTPDGLSFAELGVDERKALFARNLLLHLPLVARIRKVLDERPNHRAPRLRFQDELEDHMSEEAAIETLNTVTNWARYAEVFAYDEASGLLSLDNPG